MWRMPPRPDAIWRRASSVGCARGPSYAARCRRRTVDRPPEGCRRPPIRDIRKATRLTGSRAIRRVLEHPCSGTRVDERRTLATDRRVTARGGRRFGDNRGRPIVLLIDDHVDSRELLATVLQDVGVSLAEAGTGKQALERMRRAPLPSLVLMDLSLPDCHGTEIVR